MADIRTQFVGSIVKLEPKLGVTGYDLNALIQRLLLFNNYTINSFRLREIPILIDTFGYEGVISSDSLE